MSVLTRESFHALQTQAADALARSQSALTVLICAGTGCIASGSMKVCTQTIVLHNFTAYFSSCPLRKKIVKTIAIFSGYDKIFLPCSFMCGGIGKTTVLRRKNMSMNQRLARVSEIIDTHGSQPSQLIAILQDTQSAFNYLSQEDMTLIAHRLGISTAKVYSVATFYENFSLEPKGKHIIRVCDGTACHVRKSQPIYDAIHDYMHLTGKRKTDADGLFTLETVACLGACGLSPVLTIDGEVHAKMTPDSALALLESIRKEEELAK